MKKHTLAVAAVSLFVVLGSIFSVAIVSIPVFAAKAGDQCALPNGDKNGVIGSDDQTCCPPPASGTPAAQDDGTSCLYAKYINPAIQLISALIGIVVVAAIVFGAIEYITSGGDPQRAAAGRKRIVEALIGLAAFLLLYGFLQFIIPGGVFNGQ